MKTLILIRHAKSSWDNPDLSDFDRPLNERGKRDAPRMARRLKVKNLTIDLMISSPARRAFSTCKRMAKILAHPPQSIQTDRALYHAGEEELLAIVKRLNNGNDTVALFGHNPGLTSFVNLLTRSTIVNIPTCGVIVCTLSVDHWSESRWGCGKLLLFDYPKSKDD
jgi:phosphohistidine phosphatase